MESMWREHPKLQGRFHPDYQDDVQVIVHDGGPRISIHPAEIVWVTITGMDGDVFRGRVLNQPNRLERVRQGDEIQCIVAGGVDRLIMVTEKYLREREAWSIRPCHKCGCTDLFDAPSDLIRVVFSSAPAGSQMQTFTAFCPLCGGMQLLQAKDPPTSHEAHAGATPQPVKRPAWKFW